MTEAISVLVVNFNYGDYIEQTIRSIAAQTHERLALRICDDASTDASWRRICDVCGSLSDRFERLDLVRDRRNQGKNAWINRMVPSIGEGLMMVLDSDDTIPPEYLATLLAELKADEGQADFVYTDCNLIDAAGVSIGSGYSTAFDAALVEGCSYIPEPALIRTAALKSALPLDPKVRRGSKHDKYKRVVRNGARGLHSKATRFNYRMHDSNISGIGARVLNELEGGAAVPERILSGYWPTSAAHVI
jgi:glycosyltransferase involved in cell wall biosynthesis